MNILRDLDETKKELLKQLDDIENRRQEILNNTDNWHLLGDTDETFKVTVNDGYCEHEYILQFAGLMSISGIIKLTGGKILKTRQIPDTDCPKTHFFN